MKPTLKIIEFIKSKETLQLHAYKPTPNDVWTISWGVTGPQVHEGLVIPMATAQAWFQDKLDLFTNALNYYVKKPLKQGEFDALLSFSYNVGIGALETSTLLREINHGDNPTTIIEEWFPKWDHQGKEVLEGLLIRREEEIALMKEEDAVA